MEPDFDFSAFDLTAGERRAVLGEIKAVLLQTGARITRAGKSENSDDEYHDALVQIDDVLALASDPDACDPALAPLATCHYYRGQILFALDRQEEAYHEFNLAASSKPHTPTDAPAIRDATQRLAELEQYGRRTESTESTGSGAGPVRRDSVRSKKASWPTLRCIGRTTSSRRVAAPRICREQRGDALLLLRRMARLRCSHREGLRLDGKFWGLNKKSIGNVLSHSNNNNNTTTTVCA